MKKKALVLFSSGSEEMEVVITVDMLRRAGVTVRLVSLVPGPARGSNGIVMEPDAVLSDLPAGELDAATGADVLILPGGMGGVEAFLADDRVCDMVRKWFESGRMVAAICAAPLVLQKCGVLDRIDAFTSHPGTRDLFSQENLSRYREERVVQSGNVITSQAPGTAFGFSVAIIRALKGDKAVEAVQKGVMAHL